MNKEQPNDPNREAFERWVRSLPDKYPIGRWLLRRTYFNPRVQLAWESWCAGQEHFPGPQQDESMKFYFEDPPKDNKDS